MLNQIQLPSHTYADLPEWVVEYGEPILFWIAVLVGVGVVLVLFGNYRRAVEASKPFAFGLFFFSLMFVTARAIENYRKFIIASGPQDIIEGWIGVGPTITGLNLVLRILYYVFSWTAIATFYYESEKYIFQGKTKFILMISAVLEGIFSIALYFTTGNTRIFFQILATIGFFLCGVAPIIIYLIIGKISVGALRRPAFIVALGLTFFVIAVMAELPEGSYVVYLVNRPLVDAYLIAIVSPICMSIGFLTMLIGFKKMFSGLF